MPPNFGNPTRGACIAPGPRHSPATSPGAVPTTHPPGTAAPGATRPLAEDSLPAHRGPNTPWVCPRCPRGEHRPAARPSRQRSPGDPRAVSCAGLAPPPRPPSFPRLREAFQASRWGRGSRSGEEESRKGYFLTLHILQVEHFVQFSLACKTVSGPSAGAQEPTAAWDNATGQPEAERPRVGSQRPLPTFPSGELAPQVLGERRMDPGPRLRALCLPRPTSSSRAREEVGTHTPSLLPSCPAHLEIKYAH